MEECIAKLTVSQDVRYDDDDDDDDNDDEDIYMPKYELIKVLTK
jgi:hypothetical protein